jgi:hypothetical protein
VHRRALARLQLDHRRVDGYDPDVGRRSDRDEWQRSFEISRALHEA